MVEREGKDPESEWFALGVYGWALGPWKGAESSRCAAGLAQHEGHNPTPATFDRRRLLKSVASWLRIGLEPFQTLQLHRSGLEAKQAGKERPEPARRNSSLASLGCQIATEARKN